MCDTRGTSSRHYPFSRNELNYSHEMSADFCTKTLLENVALDIKSVGLKGTTDTYFTSAI